MTELKVGDKVGVWHMYQCHGCSADFHLSRTNPKVIKLEDEFLCDDCARAMELDKLTEENAKLKREIFKLTSLVNELFSDDESSYDAAFELSEYIGKIKGE